MVIEAACPISCGTQVPLHLYCLTMVSFCSVGSHRLWFLGMCFRLSAGGEQQNFVQKHFGLSKVHVWDLQGKHRQVVVSVPSHGQAFCCSLCCQRLGTSLDTFLGHP